MKKNWRISQDLNAPSQFILASRLQPSATPANLENAPGVQQILLLGPVSKAAILCNNQLFFYSLPELSPVNTKLKDVAWVGIDENDLALRGLPNEGEGEERDPRGVIVYVGSRKVVRSLRVGTEIRLIKVCQLQFFNLALL